MGVGLDYIDLSIRARGVGGAAASSPVLFSYNFLTSPSMPAGLSLARASIGTSIDTTGTRIVAAIDAARFQNRWNGSTWAPAGLMVEDQLTNYATSSEDFSADDNFSGGIGATVSTSAIPGANNSDNLSHLTSKVGTPPCFVYEYIGWGGTGIDIGDSFLSFEMKVDTWNYVFVATSDGSNTSSAVFDLSAEAATETYQHGTSNPTKTYIRRLRNNIYRVMVCGGNPEAYYYQCGMAPLATGNTFANRGYVIWSSLAPTTNEKIYVGGWMGSVASYETSHITTSGAAATRSADVITASGTLATQLAAGPSVWELTDLATGTTARTQFAAGAFTFPTKYLYRSFGVYPAATDTSPYLTVGGPY